MWDTRGYTNIRSLSSFDVVQYEISTLRLRIDPNWHLVKCQSSYLKSRDAYIRADERIHASIILEIPSIANHASCFEPGL